MTGKPSRKPGPGKPLSGSNQIELLPLVQTSELYDRDNPKSRPARPGRNTTGRFQLKFRESGFSASPPVSFSGSSRADDESESIGPELLLLPRVERVCNCSRWIALMNVPFAPTARVGS